MGQIFHREAIVFLDNVRVENLRIRFSVKKSLRKEPNVGEIKVSNLSKAHRSLIRQTGAQVVLQAGYQGQSAVIFIGNARTVDHVREGPDWTTIAQCGDAETSYLFGRIGQSFGPGTSILTVAKSVVGAMGIKEGNLVEKLSGALQTGVSQFTQGFTASGRAAPTLDNLLASQGFDWSIQDGALQVLEPTGFIRTSATPPLLSPQTGLIGAPEHGTHKYKSKLRTVLKARCFLNPFLKCGGWVEIQASNTPSGVYRITKLEHLGDSISGDWFTEIETDPTASAV